MGSTRFVTAIVVAFIAFICSLCLIAAGQELPTTYEYFTAGGIQSGLTADAPGFFKLNGKDIRIISGAIHYFRVHPGYWRDRLQKLRALGANAVETYVPWNLHEPERGVFDFGDAGYDYSLLLDVRRFVEIAQEEDLLVILRPGPYICTEFEFGGLPAWLQGGSNPDYMQVRTAYEPYLARAKIYLDAVLQQVAGLQFTNGGSIVAIQIENEYGHYTQVSKAYLQFIHDVYEENGFGASACLPFTSDNVGQTGNNGFLDGVLATANLQTDPAAHLDRLLQYQPDRPVMVAEYWAGWFDTWFGEHSTTDPAVFEAVLETIFAVYNGSVNLYMFHGGTDFGFTAGATDAPEYPNYKAYVTSYDYDSPLSEAGDYTEKYYRARRLIEAHQVPRLSRPEIPPERVKVAYANVSLSKYLTYNDILARIPASARFTMENPGAMEDLDMNGGSGQSYGYIVYRKVVNVNGNGNSTEPIRTTLKVGPVRDFGMLLIDGEIQPLPSTHETGYWINEQIEFDLALDNTQSYLVDILIENMGRLNWIQKPDFRDKKGLHAGNISSDGTPLTGFQVLALEFKTDWVQGLANWRSVDDAGSGQIQGPAMFQSILQISGEPADTFLDMRTWHKGIVFVNGFNLGRYFKVGPQQTLFVPAPLLRTGANVITIFEQLEPGINIQFTNQHILNQNNAIY